MERTVTVELGDRSYDVRVGSGLIDALGPAAAALPDVSSTVLVSDSNVIELYGERAAGSLRSAGLGAETITFGAGESSKTLATYSQVMDRLLSLTPPIDRSALVVALGGGVVGDLTGFVAATALRGLRWLQCPTTLLADVDASVGGKTAVDSPAGKNLIGAFHQPSGVLIDAEALKTLPDDELRNGLAECVKHGVIRDAELLGFIEDRAADILACDPETMTELIVRNVAIKAAVVSGDEREAGERAHLNFGHTVGHAIEVVVGYDKMPHGRAVSLGMVAACGMAVRRGLIDAAAAARVTTLLEGLGLPVRQDGLDADRIWQAMQHDKKARGGKVRMVLPTELGRVDIFDDTTREEVADAVRALEPK